MGEWVPHQPILYGHMSIPCDVQCDWVAANFFTSIEVDIYEGIPLEERICQLCHQEVQSESTMPLYRFL